jgi:photosystem II stability/assembly factor-like uncharacterized protein
VDVQNGVYQVNDAEFRFSHPLTTEAPREPMRIVRHRDGLFWGVSTDHIYKSNDQGASWCRVASAHVTVGGFEIRGDGHLLLWDEHGTNLEFDPETNEITPFEPFGEDDVIDIVRQRDLWVAYGGMQYETKRRIEVARTYFSGQFRGSVDRGFVYVSDDSGMTWTRADAWADGGVARVFVGHDREILLLSYLGSVRKLTKEADGWTGEDLIVASEDTWEEVPYVERAFSFYFPTPTTGFIGGWIHHLGNHYFTTADGGYTWQRIDEVDFPYRLLTPAGDSNLAVNGRELVSLTGTDASTVDMAEVIRQDEVITDISVDGQDRVLIELTKTNDKGWYTRERRWHLVAADEPASDSTQ